MNVSINFNKAPFHSQVAEGPNNVCAYWLSTDDNIRLRAAHWETDKSSKGTVFLFQGRTENIEKYGRTANELHKAGYHSFAVDWRGQGASDRLTDDRMAGHVLNYSDYQLDVAAITKAAIALDLPKPWYLLGHSLGACIGLRAIIEGFPVSACAFTSPLWDINLPILQRLGAWPLTWVAQSLGKGHLYAPGTRGESYVLNTIFKGNLLTNDPAMYQYYINISETLVDHQIGGPSMSWLFQTLKETRSLSKMLSPDIPCITFCGADDRIVSRAAAENRMRKWPNGTFSLVQNAKHDILHEIPNIRKDIFGQICDLF